MSRGIMSRGELCPCPGVTCDEVHDEREQNVDVNDDVNDDVNCNSHPTSIVAVRLSTPTRLTL